MKLGQKYKNIIKSIVVEEKKIDEARGKSLNIPDVNDEKYKQIFDKVFYYIQQKGVYDMSIFTVWDIISYLEQNPSYYKEMAHILGVDEITNDLEYELLNYFDEYSNDKNSLAYKIFYDLSIERIEGVFINLNYEMIDNKIYREISTPKDIKQVLEYSEKNGLGCCWAKRYDMATAYYGNEDIDNNLPSNNNYVLVGELTDKNINWVATLILRAIYEEENEIRLKADVPVKLVKIIDRNTNKRYNVNKIFSSGNKLAYDQYNESKNILESVNTQYLYHGMWKDQYEFCKKQNKLFGHSDTETFFKYNKNGERIGRRLYGISTSRDAKVSMNFMEKIIKEYKNEWEFNPYAVFSKKYGEKEKYITKDDDLSYVILVLDYNKIKQNNKIIPFSFLAGSQKNYYGDEQEEFIVGDLKNLNNYVVNVIEFNDNLNKKTLQSKPLEESFVKNPFTNEVECYYSKSESEVKQIIKNKFNDIPVRVLYDFVNKVYIFGNANTLIHIDLIDKMKQYGKTEFSYRYPTMEEERYKWMDKNCAMFKIINTNDYRSYTRYDGYRMGVIGKLDSDMYVILRDNTLAMERSRIFGNFVPDELAKCKKVPMLQNVKFVNYDIRSIGMINNKEQLPQNLVNESFEPKLNDNFWKWFGKSKVVDENGNPLVVYHGTRSQFAEFDKKYSKRGFFFTTEKRKNTVAGYYAYYNDNKGSIMPCYIKLENPLIVHRPNGNEDDIARANGTLSNYDGIIVIYDDKDDWEFSDYDYIEKRRKPLTIKNGEVIEYIVFEPNNIKSVNNNGNWSTTSNNINESKEVKLNDNFKKWFRNSKVVDTQGNPLVVYHGSSKLFNTFKQMKSKSGQLGADLGFWFTNNENIAKQFSNNSFVLDTDKKTYNEYIKSNEYNNKIKELKKKNEITLEDRINLYKDIVDKDEITNDELEYLKNIPFLKIEDIKEKKYRAVYQIYNNNLKYYREDLKALNNEIKRYFSNNKDKSTVYSCYLSIQNPLVVKGEDIGVSWQRYSVISSAIDEGYDGVIIIDGDTGAGLSNEYIVFNPNQIKSVNNNGNWSTTSNNINESVKPHKQEYGILYHGTNSEFSDFKEEYQNGGYLGNGFYFTMSKSMAQSYGENIIEAKLNYNSSFYFDSDVLEDEYVKQMLNTTKADDDKKLNIYNLYRQLLKNNDIYQANSKLFDFIDFYNGDSTKILIECGYDSIDNIERDSEFVVFNSNQIEILNNINETKEPKLNNNFKNWFGNSKVIDENGNPLVCYHGSPNTFEIFDENYFGLNNIKGFWFSNDKKVGEHYKQKNGKLYSCYIRLENPYILKTPEMSDEERFKRTHIFRSDKNPRAKFACEDLKKEGYDGILSKDDDGYIEVIAFYPNQIKSVNNNGNWSLDKNNIFESKMLMEGIKEVKKYFPKIQDSDFNTLIAYDPTYKGGDQLGKYGKWILSLYNNFLKDKETYIKWEEQKKLGNNYPKPIRKSQEQLEDFEKLPNILKNFEIINNILKVNINNIKSIADLYKIVNDAKNQGISTNTQTNKGIELIKKSVEKGGEVIYKDKEWIVLIPKTLESSVVFGDVVNWCTTTPNGKMFKYYKDRYNSNLYINLNLQSGELYQFHFESCQFMNKNDKPINILDFFNTNQSLFNFYKTLIKNSSIGPSKCRIMFIDNPSEEEQLQAIKYDANNIQYIKNPTEKVQKYAIKKGFNIIKYIKNPSEEVQIVAVRESGYNIQYIENPSEKVQLAAVREDYDAIKYIKNPSEKVQIAAIKKYYPIIQHIENPSEEVQIAAVKMDSDAIKYIKNPSEKVQILAIKNNSFSIEYIENPSEELQLLAVNLYGESIGGIENPSEKVQIAAVKDFHPSIQRIENPSVKAQLIAVKADEFGIQYIKNPSEEAKELYKKLYKKPYKKLFESASYGGANWQNSMDALGNVPATIGHNLFMTMFPYHFLSLCPKFSYGDDKFFDDYIESKKPIGIPFLIVDFNFDKKAIEVQDHEGRHRVAAISRRKNGNIVDIPVALLYSKNRYPQIPSIEELRKNWTIVSQKGDREYNVGQFSVYNNFPKSTSDKWFNLYENKLSDIKEDTNYILSADSYSFSCYPPQKWILIKCNKNGKEENFNFYFDNYNTYVKLCRSLLARFEKGFKPYKEEVVLKKIDSYDGNSISKEAVMTILKAYYGNLLESLNESI